jgi:hypothetical protein
VGVDVEGDLLGLEVMGLDVLGFAVGLTINPDAKLGFELGFRIGDLVGGLGSPLMQAPLICPPNEPLQHNS